MEDYSSDSRTCTIGKSTSYKRMGAKLFAFLLLHVFVTSHVTGSGVIERATDPVQQLTSVTITLSTKVDQLTSQLNSLKTDLASKATSITSLTNQVNYKNEQIKNLTTMLHQSQNILHQVDPYCKSHLTDLTTRITAAERGVGFTVRFSQDKISNMTKYHNQGRTYYLDFDVVLSQAGGANYNTSTGIFTAPSSGLYAFFLTIQRGDPTANDCVEASILQENKWLASVSACPPGYTTSSNMAINWVNKGDKIHAQTVDQARIEGYVHTSFSGMKLSSK